MTSPGTSPAETEQVSPLGIPVVLFACVHNSGRSVAAKLLTQYYGKQRVDVRSAGTEPGNGVNTEITAVLRERGLSTVDEVPTLLTTDLVAGADIVITMGCGETCPVFPAKRYLDWVIDDPVGQGREAVRRIVADIDVRVRGVLLDLGVEIDEL